MHWQLFRRIWRWTALSLLIPVLGGLLFAASGAMAADQPAQPTGTIPDTSNWLVVAGMGLFDAWNNTVTGVLIFFGFGLGLLGRVGNSMTIPLGLAVFACRPGARRSGSPGSVSDRSNGRGVR